jgi:hypothetical protein
MRVTRPGPGRGAVDQPEVPKSSTPAACAAPRSRRDARTRRSQILGIRVGHAQFEALAA